MFYKNYPEYVFKTSICFSLPKRRLTARNPMFWRHFLLVFPVAGFYTFLKMFIARSYELPLWEEKYQQERKIKDIAEFFVSHANAPSTNPLSQFSQF